jgi:hypothetical protein
MAQCHYESFTKPHVLSYYKDYRSGRINMIQWSLETFTLSRVSQSYCKQHEALVLGYRN